jgi:hypothetical protein
VWLAEIPWVCFGWEVIAQLLHVSELVGYMKRREKELEDLRWFEEGCPASVKVEAFAMLRVVVKDEVGQ